MDGIGDGTQLSASHVAAKRGPRGPGLAALPCTMALNEPELVSVPTRWPPPTGELWLVFITISAACPRFAQ
jgi:hypothetical protein